MEEQRADFLADWLPEADSPQPGHHARLSDAGRTHVAGYILALVERHEVIGHLSDEAKREYAALVWRDFRATYDAAREPGRKERTDINRVLSRL